MTRLKNLALHGWKSIRSLDALAPGQITVLIGANGSGKSNLVSFFRFLAWMTPAPGNLQLHVAKSGGANSLLHDGAATTPQLSASLTFETDVGVNEYHMRLVHAAQDTLIFADERFRYSSKHHPRVAPWKNLGAGHREAKIIEAAEQGDKTARAILGMLKGCVVYQFHNTSDTARMRQRWDAQDSRFLKEDGANLAPFLRRLRESEPHYYARIKETIRLIAPFFADFVLEPLDGAVLLQWTERGSDVVFGAHQASDGMLRIISLITLLLQPPEALPSLVILDEPELGLHPYAINVIAGLIRSVATKRQVILATQSMPMIDQFDPNDIVVVDRPGRESTFTRLDPQKLHEWLDEYSVAELWEKNVIGGRP